MKLGWKVGAIGLAAIAGACVAIGLWRWSASVEQAIGDFVFALCMLGLSYALLSVGSAPTLQEEASEEEGASLTRRRPCPAESAPPV